MKKNPGMSYEEAHYIASGYPPELGQSPWTGVVSSSTEPRKVMAPVEIERKLEGWGMNQVLYSFDMSGGLSERGEDEWLQSPANYQAANDLLVRMQFHLIRSQREILDRKSDKLMVYQDRQELLIFNEVFDLLTDCRFKIEEARKGK